MIVLLAGFALTGCQTAPSSSPTRYAPTGPTYDGYYRPRNPYFLPKPILALDAIEMNRLASAVPANPGMQPGNRWYDSRNDWQLTTTSGYRTSTIESISTQTYDRLYQHGGQIHDHYSQSTRRGTYSETVR